MKRGITRAIALVAILATTAVAGASPVRAQSTSPTKKSCKGKGATIVGTPGSDTIYGTKRQDVIVALGGDDLVYGRGGPDIVCGGGGFDELAGGPGADVLSGGGGDDLILGQGGNDAVLGGGGHDLSFGMGGADRYVGGSGSDIVGFLLARAAVYVDLSSGSAVGEGIDTLTGTEGVVGSDFDDYILGDANSNLLSGALGDDYISGRDGLDLVFYVLSEYGVTVDLSNETAVGGEGTDALDSLEGVLGSVFDDDLSGTSGPDYLNGYDGADWIDGRGGDDICVGESQVNCPSFDAPAAAPDAGDGPPPPPSPTYESYGSRTSDGPGRSRFRSALADRLGLSGLAEMDRVTAYATRWDSTGTHTCWGGGPWVWGPVVASSGYAAWRPIYVWQPDVGGQIVEYGQWRWANRDSVWRFYETGIAHNEQVPWNKYAGLFFVYNQVYDYDTQTTNGSWSKWVERNPLTGGFYDTGQYGCRY